MGGTGADVMKRIAATYGWQCFYCTGDDIDCVSSGFFFLERVEEAQE